MKRTKKKKCCELENGCYRDDEREIVIKKYKNIKQKYTN
jgi:hypothetical protein